METKKENSQLVTDTVMLDNIQNTANQLQGVAIDAKGYLLTIAASLKSTGRNTDECMANSITTIADMFEQKANNLYSDIEDLLLHIKKQNIPTLKAA